MLSGGGDRAGRRSEPVALVAHVDDAAAVAGAEWYPAPDAAGTAKRRPHHLRHTFATERSPPASRSSSSRG
jgi:hypothetical protein